MSRPPKPTPFHPEDTVASPIPKTQAEAVDRLVGRPGALESEDSSAALSAPKARRKGGSSVPPGAVGYRAVPTRLSAPSAAALERFSGARAKVKQQRDEQRQRVWDKLDAAKATAAEHAERYQRFDPTRRR